MAAPLHELLDTKLRPVVESLGYEVVDLVYGETKHRKKLSVVIWKAGRVGVDDCRAVSRAIGDELDLDLDMPEHYTLEVSTPGLDRLLRTRDDFRRAQGEKVRLWLTDAGPDGKKAATGVIQSAKPEGMELLVAVGKGTQTHVLPWELLDYGKIVIEFKEVTP